MVPPLFPTEPDRLVYIEPIRAFVEGRLAPFSINVVTTRPRVVRRRTEPGTVAR